MKNLWCGLAAALVFAACGGGGAGGGSSGEPTPVPLTSAVQVTNMLPRRIDVQAVETERSLYGVELSADVVGDLARLNGQTVYVLVEDPAQLYELMRIEIAPNGLNNKVFLKSKSTLLRAGTIEGVLKVHVCVDPACKTPLGNSPVSIPYKWTIAAAVRIQDAPSITVEVPFGTVLYQGPREVYAARRALTLKTPADFVGVNLGYDWTKLNPSVPAMIASFGYDRLIAGQSTAASLSFPPAPVGTYPAKFTLSSPTTTTTEAQSVLEVTYVVKDSGQPMLYAPARIDAIETAAETLRVVAADGKLYPKVSRIVYSANSGAVKWLNIPYLPYSYSSLLSLSAEFSVFVRRCGETGMTCLRAGSYDASVYFATDADVEAPVPFAVTLQVP